MAVDKEALICLSRVYSYYFKCNFPLFYVYPALTRYLSILFLNILTLLACTHSSDNLFHTLMVLCENENFLTEGFYTFSKVCLQFFSFLNVFFSRLFYDNITFQHLFIIIKCPAELNFDCKILIRSVPSTFVTELLLRGYVFLTFPKPTPSAFAQKQITTHYQTYPIMAINTINQICLTMYTLSNISVTVVTDN